MKWQLQPPMPGDMVRIFAKGLYHYGVCTGDDRIVEFGSLPDPACPRDADSVHIQAVTIAAFSQGFAVETAGPEAGEQRLPAEETIRLAESQLGAGGYHLLFHNCEHFASACVFGKPACTQTETLFRFLMETPYEDIYLMELPAGGENAMTGCRVRDDLLNRCGNPDARRHSYWAWVLLEAAVKNSFRCSVSTLNPRRNEYGKWEFDEIHASLSHSTRWIAAAVSKKPIGIDLEEKQFTASSEAVEKHILAPGEVRGNKPLRALWCEKEALFKAFGEGSYRANAWNTAFYRPDLHTFEGSTEQYGFTLSIAAKENAHLRFFLCRFGENGKVQVKPVKQADFLTLYES